jgi:2,3-bisphosphoglycerate-independent phosphoglycerate mutase
VLIDGVGLAPPAPHNPVAAGFPRMSQFLGTPLTHELHMLRPQLVAMPIDATLGVPGLPQSGSGHTALYGGFNAAQMNGRHQPSYPTVAMRDVLSRQNMFLAAQRSGCSVAWANAYLPGYNEAIAQRRMRHTAGTWAALAADITLSGIDDVLAGTALTWDITQQLARIRPGAAHLPILDPGDAGARLARLTATHDLIAFETYLPDLAAHGRLSLLLDEALMIVDGLLAGLISARRSSDTIIITSDHGNSEDMTTRVHTRNPVPLLAIGPAAHAFVEVASIDGIADAIHDALTQG